MVFNNPKPGAHMASEYQSSGLPWVRTLVWPATPTLVELPKVSRALVVRNLDGSNPLRVGFTENGIEGENFFEVPANSSERLELRVKQVYLMGPDGPVTGSLLAELTTIDASQFPVLSGSVDIGGAGAGWPGVG